MSADPLAILTGGLFSGESLANATGGFLADELHPRARIRKHITERLKGASTAGDRVFASRHAPLKHDKLKLTGPILCVYTLSDRPDRMVSDAPPIYAMHVEVIVEAIAVSSLEDLEDALDALALAIEAVVLRDETQGGHAAETTLLGTITTIEEDGEDSLASQQVRFQVEYHHSAEDLVGDSLEKVHVQTKPPTFTPDAPVTQDDITLEGSETQ